MRRGKGPARGIPREKARVRTQSRAALPPNLARVNAAARRAVHTRFTALLHHVDEAALERAFRRQRRQASAAVDGVTVAAYEQELETNLRDLCGRLHAGRRPLGVPVLEDKIVQGAVAEVLSAVHEADFLGFFTASDRGETRTRLLTPCTRPS